MQKIIDKLQRKNARLTQSVIQAQGEFNPSPTLSIACMA